MTKRRAGNYTFTETSLAGAYLIEAARFEDSRGSFMECYTKSAFDAAGLRYDFVQDNQSRSRRGVLRGLHFQRTRPQAKLVRVLQGEIYDVAVDLRRESETYGRWIGVLLSEDNGKQLLIPRGFAHGFLVVSERAEVLYKCDAFYCPGDEGGIVWNDPVLKIRWPDVGRILLSEKDRNLPGFSDAGIRSETEERP